MDNLNALTKRLMEIREERRELKTRDKELSEEFDALSGEVLAIMEEMGVEATRSEHASVSISIQQMPQVKDWDAFYRYVGKNNAFYLLQKRVSSKAWAEQLELEGDIPGTEPFEKRSINLRAR